MENVKRMIGYTLLAGIAAFAQIAEAGPRRARKTVTPQRDVAGMAHQSEKDEDTMITQWFISTSVWTCRTFGCVSLIVFPLI